MSPQTSANSSIYFSDGGTTDDFDQPATIANPTPPSGLTNTAVPNDPVINTTKITKFDVKTGAIPGSFLFGRKVRPLHRSNRQNRPHHRGLRLLPPAHWRAKQHSISEVEREGSPGRSVDS